MSIPVTSLIINFTSQTRAHGDSDSLTFDLFGMLIYISTSADLFGISPPNEITLCCACSAYPDRKFSITSFVKDDCEIL